MQYFTTRPNNSSSPVDIAHLWLLRLTLQSPRLVRSDPRGHVGSQRQVMLTRLDGSRSVFFFFFAILRSCEYTLPVCGLPNHSQKRTRKTDGMTQCDQPFWVCSLVAFRSGRARSSNGGDKWGDQGPVLLKEFTNLRLGCNILLTATYLS